MSWKRFSSLYRTEPGTLKSRPLHLIGHLSLQSRVDTKSFGSFEIEDSTSHRGFETRIHFTNTPQQSFATKSLCWKLAIFFTLTTKFDEVTTAAYHWIQLTFSHAVIQSALIACFCLHFARIDLHYVGENDVLIFKQASTVNLNALFATAPLAGIATDSDRLQCIDFSMSSTSADGSWSAI
jgi:hypothetical protein